MNRPHIHACYHGNGQWSHFIILQVRGKEQNLRHIKKNETKILNQYITIYENYDTQIIMTLRYHQTKSIYPFKYKCYFYEDISYLDCKMNFKMHLDDSVT